MKDQRTRIDSMQMDDDDCCSVLSLPSSAAASTTTTESAYSTTDESLSDTRSLFDDIAVYSMIAQHYFTSSAPAFASELHTLLQHEGRLNTITRIAGLLLLPRRLQRPLWTFVGGVVGGGSSARKRIEETARRHLGMSLSVDDFQMLGRRISPRCVSEWDLEAPVRGIWNIYQAYYVVLCRLARGEYEESRQGWEGMVRDVRIVLQIIYTVACVGGGVDAKEQCGARCFGGKHVMAKQAKVIA
ncbi:L-type lectin-domain containing receptor kinase [Lasiodiplodia theobromae]|uniref:L-type lectin-domain containing receptor kinase n=1 Tax=Lasiodiplodia theobromae TaxID=45133 RepID=UPI0015C3B39E|nr:L-type lectin-domain containing receptor kinase [Lasiodiplodia theobromae]KAF4536437.1 L-type lectin-domain containing receptor kinase [Lasiodiplodia theobromae]